MSTSHFGNFPPPQSPELRYEGQTPHLVVPVAVGASIATAPIATSVPEAKNVAAAAGKIFGTGEMAELIRTFDWSRTSVGPIEQWSETLLTIVNTVLASPHPMLCWWGEDLVQFYNDAYRPAMGNDKHPLALGQRGAACWPEFWSRIGPQIEQVMQGGPPIWREYEPFLITRHGYLEQTYWSYSFSAVRDSEGFIRGTLAAVLENTHRKQAETAVSDELRRISDLFEQAPAFFTFVAGPQFVFERVNQVYRQMMGNRPLLGRTVLEAVPEVAGQGYMELLNRVYTTGEPWIGRNTPLKLQQPGADRIDERVVDFIYQPMRDENGKVYGIFVLGIDMTEAKRNERALVHNEKLAAVGRLATTIAHEINNPLESVANLLHLIQGETGSPEEVRSHATLAQQEVRRIANISVNTLKFSRHATRPVTTDLQDVLASTQIMYLGRIRHGGVRVLSRYRPHAAYTSYAAELRQVFANFLGNALDATPPGGHIHIRLRPGCRLTAQDTSTGIAGIFVTIADTGCGMNREALDRMYDAFFTTKETTGTGLGLWLSKELIEKHQGRIRVRSRSSSIAATETAGCPAPGGPVCASPISDRFDDAAANAAASPAPDNIAGPVEKTGTVFRIFLPYANGLG